jgi:Bifunctional DNA primase/polymerase, N-terminal/Protein of unknown function (DUF3987)/Primase C terminal 1 (PriCT-1)
MSAGKGRAMSDVLKMACAYRQELGWPCIPIDCSTKKPLVPWKEYQEVLPNEQTLCDWFTQHPNAGVGIVTGRASNLFVIDADNDAGQDTIRTLALPRTPTVATHRGKHWYFRFPEGVAVRNTAKRVEGLDTRGEGGYVIAPPSRHPSGTRYEWIDSPFDVAPAPPSPELLALFAHTTLRVAGEGSREDIEQILAEGSPEGRRNADAARLAGHLLARGISPREVTIILGDWAKRCSPPFPLDELCQVVDSIAGREERKHTLTQITPAWPTLDEDALHGVAGEYVRAIEPHSEVDPVALLVQYLISFGNVIGRSPHFMAEADRHAMNLYGVLVGQTAKARKGSSWGHIRKSFAMADEEWARERTLSGLSSGEGLIWAVRNPVETVQPIKEKGQVTGYQSVQIDAGVKDKRLLIIEHEFASALKVMGREGNTLSAVIRTAWDTGDLSTLTKNATNHATGAHVSIIGNITGPELLRTLDSTEMANGFANRILWLCVRRSKLLPEGGRMDVDMSTLNERLKQAIDYAKAVGEMHRDDQARGLWREVYPTLSEGKPGLLGAITARAEAQVMRLASIYALLDRSNTIRVEHLRAALALWQYAEASVRYIFGDRVGDTLADTILDLVRSAGKDGVTRTALSNALSRNQPADKIHASVRLLTDAGLIDQVPEKDTGGAPKITYFARLSRT